MDPDVAGQDAGVSKLGTQAEKDRRLKKKEAGPPPPQPPNAPQPVHPGYLQTSLTPI